MYKEEFSTFFFPIEKDPNNMENWRELAKEATTTVALALLAGSNKGAAAPVSQKPSLDEGLIKDMISRGCDPNSPEVQQLLRSYQKVAGAKTGMHQLLAEVVIKGEKEIRKATSWIGFMDYPTKAPSVKNGITTIPEVFRIKKEDDFLADGEPKNIPFLSLFVNGKEGYILYFPTDITFVHAKKGFGIIECQALYKRFPSYGESHGTPVRLPEWLSAGQGCSECKYAPHRDKSLDESRGVTRENECKAFRENHGFFGGILDGVPGFLWGNLSVGGSLSYILLKETGMSLIPSSSYIVRLHNIRMSRKAGRNKRLISDATDKEQTPMCSRGDTFHGYVKLLTGALATYYGKRLAPETHARHIEESSPQIQNEENQELEDLPF